MLELSNAKSMRDGTPLYRELVKMTRGNLGASRVCRGESVSACEKIVSIFEPNTDINIKGKRCGIEVKDMAGSRRVYTKLRALRAGNEGTLSFLKRTFRLDVHCSVLACNLLEMGRRVLAAGA